MHFNIMCRKRVFTYDKTLVYTYMYIDTGYMYIYIVYIELPDGGSTWQAGVTVAREV